MPVFQVQRARMTAAGEGLSPLVTRVAVTGVAVFLAVTIVPGIESQSFTAGLAAVLVLTLLNALLRPVLYLLSLPLIVVSLGLFMIVINALLLQITAYLVKGFAVNGFWPSVWGAIVISLVTTILNLVVGFERASVDVSPPSSRPPKILNPR
ncbi:MAG: phage holin family protein [Nitrospiraceae bacterium]